MVIDKHALLDEARAFVDPGLYQGYKPFDADERIPGWKDRSPAHPFNSTGSSEYAAWVAGHHHPPSLKCYPEFGCQAIEGYTHDLISRLTEALAQSIQGR